MCIWGSGCESGTDINWFFPRSHAPSVAEQAPRARTPWSFISGSKEQQWSPKPAKTVTSYQQETEKLRQAAASSVRGTYLSQGTKILWKPFRSTHPRALPYLGQRVCVCLLTAQETKFNVFGPCLRTPRRRQGRARLTGCPPERSGQLDLNPI